MAKIFKKIIVRYVDANGQRVPKGTPGARKVKEKSGKWYGRVPGASKPTPLCSNKSAAEMMLNDLVKKTELAKAGVVDPFAEHRRRPLLEHIADYEAYLLAKGDGQQHARDTVARLRRVVAGCRFAVIDDLCLSAVQNYLAVLRTERPLQPRPAAAIAWYTKDEMAAALGIKPHCVVPLVKRWNLSADGNGKRRRFPKETVLTLYEQLNKPVGPATINHYVRSLRGFSRWLQRDRRTNSDALASLSLSFTHISATA